MPDACDHWGLRYLGGPQSLRNWADLDEFARYVYPHPEYLKTLETSTPLRHVFVDFELRGCPINHFQVLELISACSPPEAERVDAQRLHRVQAARLALCLGGQGLRAWGRSPRSAAGTCPAYQRACYGCFGPMEQPNIHSLGSWFTEKSTTTPGSETDAPAVQRLLEPFKQASDQYEQREHAF